ncbi:nuclear transport factor 2 family protein [Pseudomonas sp. MOB-449]|nr:nuclear transport factor 2 family protein [Pseudomonas sp. MOB-449]
MPDHELAALRAEVADLAARRDIEKAVRNYMRAQDRLLPELHLSAFHPDAWVDCGIFAGPAPAFVEFAQGFLADCASSQHLIGQMDIQVHGKRATGEVYFIAQHRISENGEPRDLFVAGRYQDEYEDRGEGWKIASRRERVDWARTDPAADGFLREQTRILLGARGEQG